MQAHSDMPWVTATAHWGKFKFPDFFLQYT
jgi:hypothetical protein